ncbi:MAG: hypothetical protein ACI4DU_05760 [Lachnospiraceae bacterium]
MNMHFSDKLYLSESLIARKDQLCRQLKYHQGNPSVFVIVAPLPSADNEATENGEKHYPEFFHAKYLKQKRYRDLPFCILGITDTYEEALLYLSAQVATDFQETR